MVSSNDRTDGVVGGSVFAAAPAGSWGGFLIREHGATDLMVTDSQLGSHVVWLQLEEPAQVELNTGGQTIRRTIHQGRVSILPAGRLHSGRFRHRGKHLALLLEPALVQRARNNQTRGGGASLRWEFGVESPLLRELLMLLRAEAQVSRSNRNDYAITIARLVSLHILMHYSMEADDRQVRGGLSPCRLKRVQEVVEQELDSGISSNRMARSAGLSVYHFSRAFRQSTGLSPRAYITERRIDRAKRLLREPWARIGDVAVECGFCDQSHLNRHFKRLVGMTPAAYMGGKISY